MTGCFFFFFFFGSLSFFDPPGDEGPSFPLRGASVALCVYPPVSELRAHRSSALGGVRRPYDNAVITWNGCSARCSVASSENTAASQADRRHAELRPLHPFSERAQTKTAVRTVSTERRELKKSDVLGVKRDKSETYGDHREESQHHPDHDV